MKSTRAANAVEGIVTNPAVQQQVGQSVANQASNRENQQAIGSLIASNTSNPIAKSVAQNSTAQKLGGKIIGVAATNQTVQQNVGQAIATKARSELNANNPPVTSQSPLPAPPSTRKARAVYDFVTEDKTELPFRKGDIINILDMPPDNQWWKGELNGKTGDLPSNYVELI